MKFDELSNRVIGCDIEVHRNLGPGLLESVHEQCLAREFSLAEVSFEIQKPIPIAYKGVQLDCGNRLDLLVENRIIPEIKSGDKLLPIQEA